MKTRCPHCSLEQSVPHDAWDKSVRCEECRGMFTAKPLPKVEALPAKDEMPEFTNFGPGWWLTSIAIILALAAVLAIMTRQFMAALSLAGSALTVLIPALIINYLGHISKLMEYGLTSKVSKPESKA